MKPLDLLRRTPKTNCGQCGYPTCLAFAVAALGQETTVSGCPFLDPQGLELGSAAASPRAQDGQELALIQHLRGKIGSLPFAEIAAPLGAVWQAETPDSLSFPFLGQEAVIGSWGVLLDGKEPADNRDQILLYNYVHSGGGRPPAGAWVGMESLPNSISKTRTLAVYCEDRLAQLFTAKPRELIEVASRLGGKTGEGASSTVDLVIPVLPMVPQYLLFWDHSPEDGFEAKVKILFDKHALDFLDLESLVFSAERLADRLAHLLQSNTPEK